MPNNEEEIRRLAELGAHMEHVLRAISELRDQLAQLVTKAEMVSLLERVQRLEARVEDQAPMSVWKRVTAIAVGIAAIAAAAGVVAVVVKRFA